MPGVIRWPGVIKPGTEINDIVSHEDWVPTLVAAAGEPNIKEKLLTGYDAAGKTFKVHLDGYDQRDLLAGTGPSKRKEYFYWTDDGNLAGLRYERWKIVFMEQRAEGLDVWQDPLVTLRFPKLIDLRADPFEVAHQRCRATTTGGGSNVPSRSSRRRPSWPGILPPTRSSRRGRSPAASRSIRCWRNCRKRQAVCRHRTLSDSESCNDGRLMAEPRAASWQPRAMKELDYEGCHASRPAVFD